MKQITKTLVMHPKEQPPKPGQVMLFETCLIGEIMAVISSSVRVLKCGNRYTIRGWHIAEGEAKEIVRLYEEGRKLK